MSISHFKSLRDDVSYYWTAIRKGYSSFGYFSPAEPDVRLLEDGRNVMLLVDLVYTDPDSVKWSVPKSRNSNDVFNGASIPEIFWNTIGAPWTGQYRNASLVHDYYCQNHLRSWREVHRMFYHGCLAGGVRPSKAKVMFAAVFAKGPRWAYQRSDGSSTENLNPTTDLKTKPRGKSEILEGLNSLDLHALEEDISHAAVNSWVPKVSADQVKDIERWIHQKAPTIQEIEAEIDRRFS